MHGFSHFFRDAHLAEGRPTQSSNLRLVLWGVKREYPYRETPKQHNGTVSVSRPRDCGHGKPGV